MTNLFAKIKGILKNQKQDKNIFNDLKNCQNNLVKNHSNPVFSDVDKNKILNYYNNLNNLGESLYRWQTFKQNGFQSDAQNEAEKISDTILKGGISNVHYVWRCEKGENTCEVCKALDGKEFDMYEEVPERPHPNCRCTVDIVEDKEENNNKWIMPCEGEITSDFGWRIDPITKVKSWHNGWDIKTNIGTPFKAVADGIVYFANKGDPKGYGHFIIIDHGKINGKTVTSEYGHILQHYVHSGQKVKQGQIIGLTGNEGKSTGPHLHLTIREGIYKGTGVNPSKYIKY